MKFLEHNNQTIVNLDNVSSIYFQEQEDTIIFNMNFSVNNVDSHNKELMVTSAVFWELLNSEFLEVKESIIDNLNADFFFVSNNRCINLNTVSSIKFDDYNYRIIFNLNFGFNHPKDPNSFVNDFVYLNASTQEEYNENKNEINELLSVTQIKK